MSAAKADEKEGWAFSSEMSTGIKVYTRENPDGSAHAVCGHGLIEASPARVAAEVSNPDNWKLWDSLLNEVGITKLDDTHRVVHLRMHGVWPVYPRDVCFFEVTQKFEDGTIAFATTGVNFDKYPENPDEYVRALLKNGGWHMAAVKGNPNQCMATYTMNLDPRLDLIPTWVMNWAVTRFPGIIDKVRAGIAGQLTAPTKSAEELAPAPKDGQKPAGDSAASTSWHGLW